MESKLFNHLWRDALAQPNEEIYIAEYGYPDWFDEINTNIDEVVATLQKIHKVAHITVAELVELAGGRVLFCEKFCVPDKTVQGWIYSGKKCPDYLRLLFARELGLL